ncbi:LPXTG cell wall anchor domain-containing protein, partial [Fructobacillus tropaeoli]
GTQSTVPDVKPNNTSASSNNSDNHLPATSVQSEEKHNKLPDTAKKEQGYSITGLLGVSTVLSLFGLSSRRNKKN